MLWEFSKLEKAEREKHLRQHSWPGTVLGEAELRKREQAGEK